MRRTVASGSWLYDGNVRRSVEITAKPVGEASARYDDEEHLVQSRPIPQTPDGYLYEVGATTGGEFASLAEAKAWADAQPWGPVEWEE